MKGMSKNNRFAYEHPTLDIQFYTTFTFGVFWEVINLVAKHKISKPQSHQETFGALWFCGDE